MLKDIINLVISSMEEAEKIDGLGSIDKKAYVIDMLREYTKEKWGSEYWFVKVAPLIPDLIEFIIDISKNDLDLEINKKAKRCFRACI